MYIKGKVLEIRLHLKKEETWHSRGGQLTAKLLKIIHGREFFLNPSSFYFVNPEKLRKTCDKGLVTSIPVCVSF